MEDDTCKYVERGRRVREGLEEAFGLSPCAAEGYEKSQSFLVGKWDVLYLNPATSKYTF